MCLSSTTQSISLMDFSSLLTHGSAQLAGSPQFNLRFGSPGAGSLGECNERTAERPQRLAGGMATSSVPSPTRSAGLGQKSSTTAAAFFLKNLRCQPTRHGRIDRNQLDFSSSGLSYQRPRRDSRDSQPLPRFPAIHRGDCTTAKRSTNHLDAKTYIIAASAANFVFVATVCGNGRSKASRDPLAHRELEGEVKSLGFAINPLQLAATDGAANLVPTIAPTFDWIRLAQRVPVRIRLKEIPDDLQLVSGMTASVAVRK